MGWKYSSWLPSKWAFRCVWGVGSVIAACQRMTHRKRGMALGPCPVAREGLGEGHREKTRRQDSGGKEGVGKRVRTREFHLLPGSEL